MSRAERMSAWARASSIRSSETASSAAPRISAARAGSAAPRGGRLLPHFGERGVDAARELAPGPLEPVETIPQHPGLLALQTLFFGVQLLPHPPDLFERFRRGPLLPAKAVEELLGLRLGGLAALPGFAEDRQRPVENFFGDPLLARDGERAAAPRRGRDAACRWGAGALVELHRGEQRVPPARGEALDRGEVRRDDRAPAPVQVRLQIRHGQGAALFRIGCGADLVHEREVARGGFFEDSGERLHGRRERRAVRQDLLRVADLRSDRAEYRKTRSDLRGHREAGLGEQAEEAGRLQNDRLAARVGTGDHEQTRRGGQLEIESDRVLRRPRLAEHAPPQRGEPGVKQRMARAGQDPGAVLGDFGDPPAGDLSELDFRFQRVQLGEDRDGLPEGRLRFEHRAAEAREDLLDFPPLFRGEQGELVVGLDDLQRLDEDGLSGAGTVVDDAGHPRSGGGQDGNAVPVVAQHDQGFVDELAPGVEDALELFLDLAPPSAQAPAYGGELRRGVVAQAPLRREDRARQLEEVFEAREGLPPRGEARRLGRLQCFARGFRRACEGEDGAELLGRARAAALLELRENRGDVHDAREGKPAVSDPERPRFGRLGERFTDFGLHEAGANPADEGAAGRCAREIGRELEDDVELERAAFDPGVRGTERSPVELRRDREIAPRRSLSPAVLSGRI